MWCDMVDENTVLEADTNKPTERRPAAVIVCALREEIKNKTAISKIKVSNWTFTSALETTHLISIWSFVPRPFIDL